MQSVSTYHQSTQQNRSSSLSALPPSSPASIDMDEKELPLPSVQPLSSRHTSSLPSKRDTVDDDFKDYVRSESSSTIVNAMQPSPLRNEAAPANSAIIPIMDGQPSNTSPDQDAEAQAEPMSGSGGDEGKPVKEAGTVRSIVGGRTKLVKRKSHQAKLWNDAEDEEDKELADKDKTAKVDKPQSAVGDVGEKAKEAKEETTASRSSGSKGSEQEEAKEEDEPFDPSAPVDEFDYHTEFVAKWDKIQQEMTPELKNWAEQTLENCFASIYSTVHLFHLLNNQVAVKLTDGVAQIVAEETTQKVSQDSIEKFAAKMQSVAASLSDFDGGHLQQVQAGHGRDYYQLQQGHQDQRAFGGHRAAPTSRPPVANRPGHRQVFTAPDITSAGLRGYGPAPDPQPMYYNRGYPHYFQGDNGYAPPSLNGMYPQGQQPPKRVRTAAPVSR